MKSNAPLCSLCYNATLPKYILRLLHEIASLGWTRRAHPIPPLATAFPVEVYGARRFQKQRTLLALVAGGLSVIVTGMSLGRGHGGILTGWLAGKRRRRMRMGVFLLVEAVSEGPEGPVAYDGNGGHGS